MTGCMNLWPSVLRNIHSLRLYNCSCLANSSRPMPPERMRVAPQPGLFGAKAGECDEPEYNMA
ncbi:unnamed protein product [Penicillium nalgiovense]|nr:unnamed protein product [Penicillium nalgiovense]